MKKNHTIIRQKRNLFIIYNVVNISQLKHSLQSRDIVAFTKISQPIKTLISRIFENLIKVNF